jgi:hypothetical protein
VAIVNRGKVVAQGSLAELLSPTVRLVDIELDDVEGELDESIAVGCQEVRRDGSTVTLGIPASIHKGSPCIFNRLRKGIGIEIEIGIGIEGSGDRSR